MNKQSAYRAAVSALLLIPAASVLAHPGHGDESAMPGPLHSLEPMHLLPVLAVVVAAVLLRLLRRRGQGDGDKAKAGHSGARTRQG